MLARGKLCPDVNKLCTMSSFSWRRYRLYIANAGLCPGICIDSWTSWHTSEHCWLSLDLVATKKTLCYEELNFRPESIQIAPYTSIFCNMYVLCDQEWRILQKSVGLGQNVQIRWRNSSMRVELRRHLKPIEIKSKKILLAIQTCYRQGGHCFYESHTLTWTTCAHSREAISRYASVS